MGFTDAVWPEEVGVTVGVFCAFCMFKGYREYAGANYPLAYRVCGAPLLAYGYLDTVVIGLELVNGNKVDLLLQPESRRLTIADRNATRPMPTHTYTVKASSSDEDDPKLTDFVQFNPPLTPKTVEGYARYEFKYGPSAERLKQKLVIDGLVTLAFTEGGQGYSFRFSPSKDTSDGYSGTCDIEQQTQAEPSPEL